MSLRGRAPSRRAGAASLVRAGALAVAALLAPALAAAAAPDASDLSAPTLHAHAGVAPDFAARDLKGRPVRFASLRGQVVLLNFWATWCAPCRDEMPAMQRLHLAYHGRGLVVLALSQDQAPAAVVAHFVESMGLGLTVWHDPAREVGRRYGIPGLPSSYLITHDGEFALRALGAFDWDSPDARGAIELLLDEAGR